MPDRVRKLAGLAARALLLLGGVGLALRVALPRPAGPGVSSDGRGRPAAPPSHGARMAGHETSDVHAAIIYKLMLLFASIALAVTLGMLGLQRLVLNGPGAARPALTAQQRTHPQPPAPGLQADPAKELRDLQAAQNARLDHYAWANPAHTIARIPINEAKALILGRSLDTAP